ncbi:MAG TPA: YncE family protein [Terriglobales bacterium]
MDSLSRLLMTSLCSGRLWTALLVSLIFSSCGDYYRPVAFPEPGPPPDPSALHFSLVISDNGNENPGTSSRIDVSGDTNVGVASVGRRPVHAALLPNGSRVFVANDSDDVDTISSYSPSDATQVTTISLESGSNPVFVHTTQNDVVYVANSGSNTVAVISVSNNVVANTIAVGSNPVALAELPNRQKLYVVNQGSGDVTSINTVDRSVNPVIATGANPVMAVARSDSARVYSLNEGSGTVSVIDTSSDAVLSSPTVDPGSNFMFYDKALNRLYIVEPSRKVAVFDVSVDPPVALAPIDLSGAGICPAGCTIDGLTVLPDGSRVYVATHSTTATCSSASDTPPCITSRVTVVREPGNTILTTMDSGAKPDVPVVAACDTVRYRRSIAAAADGTRVFASNCDAGSTGIIRTSDDTHVLDLPAPVSAFNPPQPNAPPPPQNPVLVLAGR